MGKIEYLSDSTLNTTIAYQVKNKFDQLWIIQLHAIEPMYRKNGLKKQLLAET
jgi:hypothetical protein